MGLAALAAAVLAAAVGVVLFSGAEALSLALLSVLAEGDEGLGLPWDDDEGDEGRAAGLAELRLLRAGQGANLPARMGMGWLLRLVAWVEGRSPRVRGALWAVGLGCAILLVRLGAALDAVLGRGVEERHRRRLGRRLLYEMVVAHRGQ